MAVSPQTRTRVSRATGALSTAAVRRLETDLEWYRALSAADRSWVGLVAQAGVTTFVGWLAETGGVSVGPGQDVTAEVFGTAPRELTWSVTLELVRCVVDAVEDEVLPLAADGDEAALREAVLRYSREVAFSAAQVYAQAAEARGAWDARLEALVVDAVVRAEADDSMQSRATALGWGSVAHVTVVAGSTPPGPPGIAVDAMRRAPSVPRRTGAERWARVAKR